MSIAKVARDIRVESPLNGELLSEIPIQGAEECNQAVLKAEKALPEWQKKTLKQRVQVFYNYRQLLIDHREELTQSVQKENGKTEGESRAEVDKAIEITEFACSLPQFILGESLEVSKGIQCQMTQEPLGVVASITPFNFPVMVPHWTIPISLCLGNALILKPSEKVPLSPQIFEKLLLQAGVPEGVFQVLNGEKELVEAICDHPQIKAVSFVGSTPIAKVVYERASKAHKRVLCLGGAKNHLIVLPDADLEMTAQDVVASMSGCCGQRCMAASAMVAVGDSDKVVARITERAKDIVPGKNLGAVITKEAKERIERYITEAEAAGAKVLVDGRGVNVEGHENGHYVGATVIDQVTPDMAIAKEEVFGPVLSIMRVETVTEAIEIENGSPFGNGASVYTQSGKMADRVCAQLKSGMVGVNIGVPVPREPFSFGGWEDSKFGVGDITGKSSVAFWTQLKKRTTKWAASDSVDWMS